MATERMLSPKGSNLNIREVWAHNLESEFYYIFQILGDYPYISMDTEFPGFVVELEDMSNDIADDTYQTMRVNVDLLKMIQLGLTFSDKNGNLPRLGLMEDCVWQFNFKDFNPNNDTHACDSLELLKRSGIDFEANAEHGIAFETFRKLFLESGLLGNQYLEWVTFHGCYDFGYLLKLITCKSLPSSKAEFLKLVQFYFPKMYDTKYVMYCNNIHGGLERLAKILDVQRVGQSHQAGSDSLLTAYTFQKLKEQFVCDFTQGYTQTVYDGILYGL